MHRPTQLAKSVFERVHYVDLCKTLHVDYVS